MVHNRLVMSAVDTAVEGQPVNSMSFPHCSIINESYVLGLFGVYRKLIYQHENNFEERGKKERKGRRKRKKREREQKDLKNMKTIPILSLSLFYLFYIFEIYYGEHYI